MIVISILVATSAYSREYFELSVGTGDKLRTYADKGYVRLRENIREVVGNVIIKLRENAIYGEKATIEMDSGRISVVGNVRYVAPMIRLYGSKLFLNFRDGTMRINNARILTDNFVVLGKELSRISEDVFVGEDAEYTTCQDCPESWSIAGKRIHVTVGQYIRVWHAQIKINGTVVMYIPYIILPIKQERESGLLFPSLSVVNDEGAWIHQPFYWAIGPYNDLTLTPARLGKRGWGSEIEYRQMLGQKKWFEFNTLNGLDEIYEPRKEVKTLSGDTTFRHFSQFEHHYTFGNSINHHFFYSDAKDLDMARDYDSQLKDRLEGSELLRGGFIDYRTSWFNLSAESYYNRNLLIEDPKDFDDSYVQILPQLSFSTIPISIFSSTIPMLQNISLGFEGDLTMFRQNHYNENSYIRNARRLNLQPYVDWNLGHLGPVSFKTNLTFDYQDYFFPYEETQNSFSKYAFVTESEASIEVSRIFGLARKEKRSVGTVLSQSQEAKNKNTIGEIPPFKRQYANDTVIINHNGYKHSQIFKLKHYFIGGNNYRGSDKFYQQIIVQDGLFDLYDPIRGDEYKLSHSEFKTSLPLKNTLELQWNNTLIRKSPGQFDVFENDRYLKDNFSYSAISFFNVSQGYDLEAAKTQDFTNSLTRLHVNFGFSWDRFTISLQEYYFYSNRGNILSLNMDKRFDFARLTFKMVYDSFSDPVNKYVVLKGSLRPLDIIELSARYHYDIERELSTYSEYNLLYSPLSKCWQINFQRSQSELDLKPKYSFNLVFNFDGSTHSSLVGDDQL